MGDTLSREGKTNGHGVFFSPVYYKQHDCARAELVLTVLCVVGWKRIGRCPPRPHVMSHCVAELWPHCLVVNAVRQGNTVLH